MNDHAETLAAMILESERVVVFTGAGISTASGIPDYRGPDGVWTRRDKGLAPPEPKVPIDEAQPNSAHAALVRLQELDKLDYLISQNIDNLHLASGIAPERLAELHGNRQLMRCQNCGAIHRVADIGWDRARFGSGHHREDPHPEQPPCTVCGGRVVSSIVHFGDRLPMATLEEAYRRSQLCDLFLVLGSSLAVSPANILPVLALEREATLVIVNMGETDLDGAAHLRVDAPIDEVLVPAVEIVVATIG